MLLERPLEFGAMAILFLFNEQTIPSIKEYRLTLPGAKRHPNEMVEQTYGQFVSLCLVRPRSYSLFILALLLTIFYYLIHLYIIQLVANCKLANVINQFFVAFCVLFFNTNMTIIVNVGHSLLVVDHLRINKENVEPFWRSRNEDGVSRPPNYAFYPLL